ncbi:hypothetical protein HME9304_01191 [Flagellimonas maritima]|uniref:Uncharacterized protein n=1 Tax=Flagellimonas maritima TaxID=1383885 RepID=A0A2Z4LQM7_9FLAO|nr:hypothetical protein [Allomuricauda aurantiaca]AWX44191.1 hypothetical protein HME9304_01191 [Allomuricauda aurantiaca]
MNKRIIGYILIGLAALAMILKWTILKNSEYTHILWISQLIFLIGGFLLLRNEKK